jgi:hypothetical protein
MDRPLHYTLRMAMVLETLRHLKKVDNSNVFEMCPFGIWPLDALLPLGRICQYCDYYRSFPLKGHRKDYVQSFYIYTYSPLLVLKLEGFHTLVT